MKLIAKNLNLIGLLLLATFTAAAAGLYFGLPGNVHATPTKSSMQFACPMHPQIIRDSAGNCPACGMKLVALQSGETPAAAKADQGCCAGKPAASAPASTMTCPHLASLTNTLAAPAGCCPHE